MQIPEDIRVDRIIYARYDGVLESHREHPMLAVGFLGKIAGVKPEIPSVSLEGWEIHQLKQDSKYFFKPNEGLVEASLEVEPLEVEGFRYVFRLDGLRVVPSITFDDFMIPRIVGRNNRILASMLIDKIGMLKNPR